MDNIFFLKGLLLGFVIAAPTGPIGILCARRTLTHGRRAGFASGMGAAVADMIYGFIAAFGVAYIAHLLVAYHVWLRIVAGLLLCYLGIRTFLSRPNDGPPRKSGRQYAGMFTSVFFLTLTNPMTILSFGAVFTAFGLAGARGDLMSAGKLVMGVFLGSALWWFVLIAAFSLLKHRITSWHIAFVNRIGGAVIGATGLLALISAGA